MLFSARPYSHPVNWFPYEVTGSIELLSAYVEDIETQVSKGIARYNANAETIVVESTHPEEPPRVITHHLGLEDETWDLDSIFKEYFPNLQRRSAVITLYAFFEHELEKICKRIGDHSEDKTDLSAIREKGILRSTTYLQRVAGMENARTTNEWHEIREIQLIRNLIAHADGRLPALTDGRRANLERKIKNSKHLHISGVNEIGIGAGYLAYTLNIFSLYFEQVHEALRRKYEA